MSSDGSGAPSAIGVLKWPLAGLLISILLSVGLISGAFYFLSAEQKREKVNQRALSDAQGRLANANKEIEDLRQSVDTYNRLNAAGAFVEERRLRWVEDIKSLRERYRLQSLEVDLGIKRPVAFPSGVVFPSLDINASRIQLKAKALHDEEVFKFINDLNSAGLGLFPMERCTMKVIPPVNDDPLAPRMEGDCILHWITIVDKRVTQPASSRPVDAKSSKSP